MGIDAYAEQYGGAELLGDREKKNRPEDQALGARGASLYLGANGATAGASCNSFFR